MLAAFGAVCLTSPIRPQDHWMSSRSLSMSDARKAILAGNDCYATQKIRGLRHCRLPKPRQERSRCRDRVRSTDLPSCNNCSAVTPFRCLVAMPPEGSTRAWAASLSSLERELERQRSGSNHGTSGHLKPNSAIYTCTCMSFLCSSIEIRITQWIRR
ncbi:hypothetical protein T265_04268 [Opisthorchis viverrini]|uniref:Uncharacterized protein n=1 Tax=Opisthorchis viverrini TaxID=6198 RepID=A0A074ZT13_OPIVI|nr:hypothetical protein T265_04268 [Opisthorchis viverrini]KER28972.1 hypothetical protein T265_04268 [Opisthorchis viverrini]